MTEEDRDRISSPEAEDAKELSEEELKKVASLRLLFL